MPPLPVRSDRMLILLLLLTRSHLEKQGILCPGAAASSSEAIITGELFAKARDLASFLESHSGNETDHVPRGVARQIPLETDRFLTQTNWGLSVLLAMTKSCNSVSTQTVPLGILLGIFDTAMQHASVIQVQSRCTIESSLFSYATDPRILRIRKARKLCRAFLSTFQSWLGGAGERETTKLIREIMCLNRNQCERESLNISSCDISDQLAKLREKIDRLQRVLQMANFTQDGSAEIEARIDMLYEEHDNQVSDYFGVVPNAFEIIEKIRSCIHRSTFELTPGKPAIGKDFAALNATFEVMASGKLLCLLKNLAASLDRGICCTVLSSSQWFFHHDFNSASSNSKGSEHNVLVVSNWDNQKSDVRCSWPRDALIYEVVLPEVVGWSKGGVLVAVACSRDNRSAASYHCRSAQKYTF